MEDHIKKTILLVEDEIIIAMSEKAALEKYGYNVIMANTSEESFTIFGERMDIDLVLLDIDLGEALDGTGVAKKILLARDIPIVFLSNQTEPELVRKIEQTTSYGYVVKNSGITIIDASIKMALRLFDANSRIRENELKLRHVVRLHALLSQINQAIVRIKDQQELYSAICRVAVEEGRFRMAWIGVYDMNGGKIVPTACRGHADLLLSAITVPQENSTVNDIVIYNDISLDGDNLPLRDEALRRDCRSSATVPFMRKGKPAGTLSLFATETDFFTLEERNLLQEISEDISFALDAMDSETDRKRAEAAVLEATRDIALREVETLLVLGRASEYKDPETANHIARVAHTAKLIAQSMGLTEEQQEMIYFASPLHDVGKLGIPDLLLLKPGALTEAEYEKMKKHTAMGYDILKSSKSVYLQAGAEIALTHHEKYAGNGYPHALKGEEIPLFGRIVAVADAYDAMVSRRPYKEPWPVEKATAILVEESGKQFDPVIVEALLKKIGDVIEVYERLQD